MYKRPEETDNHLARSSVALRFPVTRKKCAAPPRRRECKVKPSLPRLKKERRREKYFRKLHGDMHTKCSEELLSRQKYRNRLVTELSVTVTCSRVPFLDPVFCETEVEHCCITKVHTITKSEPQHFAAAKHAMKTDQDAKCNVQTPLYACQTCNTTDHRWVDRRCTPRHLVASPGFQLFPSAWNSPMQLWCEMMQGSQSVFSLQLPTVLPRVVKVHHPSAKLYRALVCENRPDNERNSTTFADNVPG